jgi:putative resolvase
MDRLISIGELAELKAVSVDTIRRWEREGKIKSVRTDGGHRRYKLGDFVEQAVGKTIAYARVSSHDQKSDLDRQDAVLSGYCAAMEWNYEVIRDLGSGMNYRKKGLTKLIATMTGWRSCKVSYYSQRSFIEVWFRISICNL